MQFVALQSGSNGNSVYVEAGGARLLFDAGISGRQAELRLAEHGRDIRDVDAVFVSHDHRDHVRCAGVYHRKFGLPVYVTEPTLRAASAGMNLGAIAALRHFRAGSAVRVGGVAVETVRTPHDGADGVAFVVDDGRRRLGILTDLGHVFDGLAELIGSLDAVLIEANYDPRMLAAGPYPAFLKRRIRGDGGHLSNAEAAELLRDAGRNLAWAALGHLSEENNRPALALRTVAAAVAGLPLHLAGRYQATDVLDV